MTRGYAYDELLDLADALDDDVVLGSNADHTGVVLPPQYVPGQLLTPNQAARLGAQLLLAAQLHDAIAASGSAKPRDVGGGPVDVAWVTDVDLAQLLILWVGVGHVLDAGDMIESDVAIARDLMRTLGRELRRRTPVRPRS